MGTNGTAAVTTFLLAVASATVIGQAPASARRCANTDRPCSDARPSRAVRAVRAPHPPVIDGRLQDDVWMLPPPTTEFTQRDPVEGQPPSQPTEVRFLYDDQALYIGARMFDSDPDHIVRRMSSRDDGGDADSICFYLDPLHDRLTGAVFRVTAANVQEDFVLSQRLVDRRLVGRRLAVGGDRRRSGMDG